MASDKRGTLYQVLTHPAATLCSAAGRIPGASAVSGTATNVLDVVGAVSPRSRRLVGRVGARLRGAADALDRPFTALGAAAVGLRSERRTSAPVDVPTPLDVAKAAEAHRFERPPREETRHAASQWADLDSPSDRLP